MISIEPLFSRVDGTLWILKLTLIETCSSVVFSWGMLAPIVALIAITEAWIIKTREGSFDSLWGCLFLLPEWGWFSELQRWSHLIYTFRYSSIWVSKHLFYRSPSIVYIFRVLIWDSISCAAFRYSSIRFFEYSTIHFFRRSYGKISIRLYSLIDTRPVWWLVVWLTIFFFIIGWFNLLLYRARIIGVWVIYISLRYLMSW